jgi:hypothetical protein
MSKGFFRVFGLTKVSFLLAFTLAAYNIDRLRSFRAKQAASEAQPKRRARRRQGTWGHLRAAPPEGGTREAATTRAPP